MVLQYKSVRFTDNQPIHKFLGKGLSYSHHNGLQITTTVVGLKYKYNYLVRPLIYHYLVPNCSIDLPFAGGVEWDFRRLYAKYLRNQKTFIN